MLTVWRLHCAAAVSAVTGGADWMVDCWAGKGRQLQSLAPIQYPGCGGMGCGEYHHAWPAGGNKGLLSLDFKWLLRFLSELFSICEATSMHAAMRGRLDGLFCATKNEQQFYKH